MKVCKRLIFFFLLSLILVFTGCFDSDDDNNDDPPQKTSISGVASKGPLNGATIKIYKIVDGQRGDFLGETTTDAEGSYTFELSNWSGPVMAIAVGGKYKDEATGTEITLSMEIRAVIPDTSSTVKASVTPLTELATRDAEKAGLSKASIEASNKKVAQFIGSDDDITTVTPFDPTEDGAENGKSDSEKKYTLVLAAVSQMSASANNESVEDIIEKIEEDFKDGVLDETGQDMVDAVETYTSNNDWADDVKDQTVEKVEEIKDEGVQPTGSIADAKKALIELMKAMDNEENPDFDLQKEKFEAFLSYMDSFVADTSEAHLLKSIAIMLDIYNSDSVSSFIENELKADNIFDPDELEIEEYELVKILFTESQSGGCEVQEILEDLEAKFKLLKEEIAKVASIDDTKFDLSVTGMDTLYFDQIDVKIAQAYAEAGLAAINSIKAHRLEVENWTVRFNDEDYDFNEVITEEIEIPGVDEADIDKQFLSNNPKLLTFKDTPETELNAAVENIENCMSFIEKANEMLGKLTPEQLKDRAENSFEIDSFGFEIINEYVTKIIPGISNLVKNSDVEFVWVDTVYVENYDKIVIGTDGYGHWAEKHKLVQITLAPTDFAKNEDLTIGDFFAGTSSLRSFILSQLNEEGDLYKVTEEKVLKELYEIDDEGIDLCLVSKTDISIDGNSADWSNVSSFKIPEYGIEMKNAYKGDGEIYSFYLNVYDINAFPKDEEVHIYIGHDLLNEPHTHTPSGMSLIYDSNSRKVTVKFGGYSLEDIINSGQIPEGFDGSYLNGSMGVEYTAKVVMNPVFTEPEILSHISITHANAPFCDKDLKFTIEN